MAHAAPFIRVQASGTMLGGREIWSCGWSLIGGGAAGFRNQEEMAGGITQAVSSWFTRSDSQIHSSCLLDLVKVNVIGTDGRYASDSVTTFREVASVAGTASGGPPLPQASVVVSLLTAAARGRGSRGRFFPPMVKCPIEPDGYITTANVELVAQSARTLVAAMNSVGQGNWVVGVSSDLGEGVQRPVTAVSVGNVYDVVRSRRNALVESYSTVAV